MTIRVAIADDQSLLRAGLRGIIGTAPDMTVVGDAGTGRQAVALVRAQRPDVVLMDIRMPDVDGLDATRLITAETTTKVLVLTTFDLDDYIYGALRGGASGFLLKDTPPRDLLAGIRIIAAGDALLAPSITRKLIAEFSTHACDPRPPSDTGVPALTHREREVLALVADGLSNAEIAQRLRIAAGTVKTHVAHLLTKLNARDRIQLVILAHRAPRAAAESIGTTMTDRPALRRRADL